MRATTALGRGRNPNRTKEKLELMNCDKIKELASMNLSIDKICRCLGLNPSFYYDHRDEHPEWDRALKEGRAIGVKNVAEALIKTAKRGNVTAQIFFLKNADPEQWNKEQTNINAKVNIESVEDLSDEDLDLQIKKLEKKADKETEQD